MKAKIAIIGKGNIGWAIKQLLKDDYEIKHGDITEGLDARDINQVREFLQGINAVISAGPFAINKNIGTVAAEMNIGYFDLTEDVETTEFIRNIKSESVMMPQCGLAPGAINICAAGMIEKFDSVKEVMMRVGALPRFTNNEMSYYLSWSTNGLINEYCNEADAIYEGKSIKVMPLEGAEKLTIEGESYESLRSQVRKEMVIQRVQQGRVSQEIDITEQELEGFLQTDAATKELSPELFLRQILVSNKTLADEILNRIDQGEDFADLAEQYSTNNLASVGGEMGWRNLADLPSLFATELKNKKNGYISPPLEGGSGFYILKIENKRGDLVRFEEQWSVRHILMMPTKLRDKTFTKKELEEVRVRALDGEDFSLLAKEFSEDPGSASRGGDLDWLSVGETAPAFEKMMLETPLMEFSVVFESQFGFHFLQVLEKRTDDLTEEMIKDRAYGILFSQKYDEELENTLRTIRAEAFVEFKELD